MFLKTQLNNLRILKNMLVLAYKEANEAEKLKQNLQYNPGFSKEFPEDDVPTYIYANGYVAKKTKNGIKYL